MFEIEEPPAWEEPSSARRWTFGRVTTDLAIVMVAVPIGIYCFKCVTGCGADFLALSLWLGLLILAIRPGWRFLKAINDRLDRYLPNHPPDPKPEPLDDY